MPHRCIINNSAAWWEHSAQKLCKNRPVIKLEKKVVFYAVLAPRRVPVWTWLHETLPTESISVNKIPLLTLLHSLCSSEWRLCFSCRDRLSRAPINEHHCGKNGNELPFQRPHWRCTVPTFSKFQIPGDFSVRAGSYFDLAFCLTEVAGAGFGAGSGAWEGLTELYKLKHLQRNRKWKKTCRWWLSW